jgi:rhodanese-related sulfurtransferase
MDGRRGLPCGDMARRESVDEVKQRLDRGEPIVFIDARNPTAWAESPYKVPGAIRIPADQVDHNVNQVPQGRSIATYCT